MSTGFPALFSGQQWRATHQATVDSIIGPGVRTVRSFGDAFFNSDTWTGRGFAERLCRWAELNPGKTPTPTDIAEWVTQANAMSVPRKEIVIAQTPDDLSRGLAHALVGGGYHEAWHTKWSRRTPLHMREVETRLLEMWALIPYEPEEGGLKGWAGLAKYLLHWSNIIEDIRIERLGAEVYPGSAQKMEALQDLILEQEKKGQEKAQEEAEKKGEKLPPNLLNVIAGTFRDLGLGYATADQDEALRNYEKESPEGFEFVKFGPLARHLERSITMDERDDLGSLWVAMEVLAEIAKLAKAEGMVGKKGEPEEKGKGKGKKGPKGKRVWTVGDRAKLKSGPDQGREVEVTSAGTPDAKGVQRLEYVLV